jgi:hypothetical protein
MVSRVRPLEAGEEARGGPDSGSVWALWAWYEYRIGVTFRWQGALLVAVDVCGTHERCFFAPGGLWGTTIQSGMNVRYYSRFRRMEMPLGKSRWGVRAREAR